MPAPAMNADEIAKLLRDEFPQFFHPGRGLSIERVDYGNIRVKRRFQEDSIRPGGTISGPTMMELADAIASTYFISRERSEPRWETLG